MSLREGQTTHCLLALEVNLEDRADGADRVDHRLDRVADEAVHLPDWVRCDRGLCAEIEHLDSVHRAHHEVRFVR